LKARFRKANKVLNEESSEGSENESELSRSNSLPQKEAISAIHHPVSLVDLLVENDMAYPI